jgi:hypothetical protein
LTDPTGPDGDPLVDLDTRMRLREDRVSWKRAGDEIIALELEGGNEYLAARGCAAQLWQRLAEPVTGMELATWVAGHYGVAIQRACADVRVFLAELSERGLLEPG